MSNLTTVAIKAREARRRVLEMIYEAQSSHIASNLSAIDFLTVLYERTHLDVDEVIISKGWIAASVYYFLSQKGVIPESDLDTYCKDGSKYIGLIEPTVKGVKCAGGSMGYGLPFGVGFALAKKLQKKPGHVYVVMSDGEQAIGTTWESALLAAHHNLRNLTVIVDANGFQAMGQVKSVLNIEPLGSKWSSFGWHASEIDGHNQGSFSRALNIKDVRPKVIICRTIKGKGVSFMEQNGLLWHYKNVTKEDYEKAMLEL